MDYDICLKEAEHNMYAQGKDPKNLEEESEQYQWGYMHAIDEVKRKIHLRTRDFVFKKGNLNPNQPSSSMQSEDRIKEKAKEKIPCKEPMDGSKKVKEVRLPTPVEVERSPLSSIF